ncbi:MAG: hypothetical protein H6708_10320 [Kofleriaceae bacterium]|nr:hypothetical protein [Kofleriaceae bacterium]
MAQARATARHDLTRTTDRIASGGATGWSWLRAPAQRAVTVPTVKVADEGQRSLFPGWLALGLTGVALAGVRRRRRDGAAGSTTPATTETTSAATSATTTTCDVELIAWTGAAAVVLSLAPRIPGIAAAMHHTPGLAQIRSFWRIGAVAHVVIAILLALGAEALAARWRDRPRRVAAAWVVGALAVIELWPAPQRLAPVPDRADHAALLAWLDRDVAADAPLAVLPGPSSGHVEDFEAEARAMYVGLWHHHPLTGGYSSYFPAEHDALYRDLRGFPSKKATAALRAVGVDHVLADAAWLDGGGRRQRLAGAGWRVAFHDDQLGVDGLVATAAASSGSEVDRDVEDGADPERLPGHR